MNSYLTRHLAACLTTNPVYEDLGNLEAMGIIETGNVMVFCRVLVTDRTKLNLEDFARLVFNRRRGWINDKLPFRLRS